TFALVSGPAGGQAGQGRDVRRVPLVPGGGRLHDHRYALGGRVGEQLRERGLAQAAHADGLLPVPQRTAPVPGVVGLHPRPAGPPVAPSGSGAAAGPPGAAGWCPAPPAWQVPKHTPSFGCQSTASRYGPRSSTRAARLRPPPALGSTSSSGPSRSSRGSSTSR